MPRSPHPVNIPSVRQFLHCGISGAAAFSAGDLHSSPMATLTEQIRDYLKKRGDSVRRIHLRTGLNRATVADFLNGRDVRGQTLDAICEYIGAAITLPPIEEPPSKPTKKSK